ncbi:MAG TPA: group 1 truncated hemoglobin [Bauldia sp.]|nr:group 1 truncated hemoglobin [Bauldia sp.]
MSRIRRAVLAASLIFPLSAMPALSAETTLYQRLGGYDAIAAVTDDFLAQLMNDEEFAVFFAGMSDDTVKRVRQEVVEFFCQATGGPCNYTGRDMKVAHTGLGITAEQWQKSLVYFAASMNKFKVPEDVQAELAAAVGPLEKDIVEVR